MCFYTAAAQLLLNFREIRGDGAAINKELAFHDVFLDCVPVAVLETS
jgi:hypothetical protein